MKERTKALALDTAFWDMLNVESVPRMPRRLVPEADAAEAGAARRVAIITGIGVHGVVVGVSPGDRRSCRIKKRK